MKLYNTLTRQIDDFTPRDDKTVRMYSCGLTVYSQPHIGNWTGYIYWDVLVRTLLHAGWDVERTQNYTDVGHLTSDDDSGEDKMEKGARREGLTAWDVAEKYIAIAEHEGYGLLGLKRPTHIVRATDMIERQISFAKGLESKGFTYIIPGEGLYFDTSKLADYGKLARLDITGLDAGARVSVEGKRNITDFAIWKFSPTGAQRDMEWDSPWGKGFPGWHLECSVIARETLGDQIDLHTGGIDHIPVHHTNEIAQTEALTGREFSHFWAHNNHIKVDGTKISKSLGNIYTLDDIVSKGFDIAAFKVMVFSKHYRTEGNFTWEILEAAQNRLRSFREMADRRWQPTAAGQRDINLIEQVRQDIINRAEDDLDTPGMLAGINQLEAATTQGVHPDAINSFTQVIETIDEILGLKLLDSADITDGQKALIARRQAARDGKDWATSDRLRDTLTEGGIGVRDTPQGPIWYRLR